ncbi:hypothetical protein PACTADRAFT_48082 [Pachysolen tannophilus NRRL Y-2460]|uniref:A to I editase domain-containing protein n=1 Tax=Pachysolen tannophilus NRRL Y-2460 TaxID=669874 RepID=A0A1E4U2R1_PACTA|nr:hypothetical protein PACTADRAFT_48082 [Pachysolen tannophilus NRRL Y-2460]
MEDAMSGGSIMSSESDSVYEKDEVVFGNKVAGFVLEEFAKATKSLKSGLPITRSNGVKEWTVLSSVIVMMPSEMVRSEDIKDVEKLDSYELKCLCWCTGVKAVPDKVIISKSNGMIVHDLHSEILSFRALNYIIIDEISQMKHDPDKYESFLIERDASNGRFRIKKGLKFCLYISEPPCGDSSTEIIQHNLSDSLPWEEAVPRKKLKLQKNNCEILRGREFFGKLGQVRTKPGRKDSELSLSKSCSDKLTLKQFLGLTNNITSVLLENNCYLDFIILPQDKIVESSINRCFKNRIDIEFSQKIFKNSKKYKFHQLKVIPTTISYKYCKPISLAIKEDNLQIVPSNLSLVMIFSSKFEVLCNGVKNGTFSKKSNFIKPSSQSFLSRKALVKKSLDLLDETEKSQLSYVSWKKMNKDRELIKTHIRELLRNWVCTGVDDFVFQDL